MIQASFSEAYLYDVLAIYSIKYHYCEPKDKIDAIDNRNLLIDELTAQLGFKHDCIISSDEYMNLYDANLKVFDLINKYKQRGEILGDAKAIDMANYNRFLAKKALQEKFFPSEKLKEQKIGYEKKN